MTGKVFVGLGVSVAVVEPRPRLIVLGRVRTLGVRGDSKTATVLAVVMGSSRRRCSIVPSVVSLLLHGGRRGGWSLRNGR